MNYTMCPRCREFGLERFDTHNYCANCNYSNVTLTKAWNGNAQASRKKELDELATLLNAAFTPF